MVMNSKVAMMKEMSVGTCWALLLMIVIVW